MTCDRCKRELQLRYHPFLVMYSGIEEMHEHHLCVGCYTTLKTVLADFLQANQQPLLDCVDDGQEVHTMR